MIDLTEVRSPIKGAVEWIEDDATVGSLAGGWVFGHEFAGDSAAMPRAAIVVQQAGGWGSDSEMPVDRVRIDVRNYGPTTTTAEALAFLVHQRLKSLRRVVAGGVLLHSALAASGYYSLRQPGTEWPVVVRSYFLLFDEREVAA